MGPRDRRGNQLIWFEKLLLSYRMRFIRGSLGILLVGMFVCWPAFADRFQLGTGLTSFTSGRRVPSLYLGLNISNYGFGFHSTGYRSRHDYLAGYVLMGFYRMPIGELFTQEVELGVGGGGYFGRRGFRDTPTSENIVEWDDFNIGPAFRVSYHPGFFFVRIETLLALSSPNNIILVFQDMTTLSLGVRF